VRPDYIHRLHAAKYDLRFCLGADKPERLRLYRVALETAVHESGFTGPELEAALRRDFGDWMKEHKLPKPPAAGA